MWLTDAPTVRRGRPTPVWLILHAIRLWLVSAGVITSQWGGTIELGDECKSESGSHRKREEGNRDTFGIERDALPGEQEGWPEWVTAVSGMSNDVHLRCADGRTVAARWLALIIIAQKSKEGGKERERVGREGRMGWNLLAVSCAALAEGEAMDVRLRIEEKKNRKPSKTR
ncbi:hypothetical protein BGY98DRAFT_1180847 [Russula aff. rugulosa BPL654]|nr:hypothetical protein BGY98DRAFT_1180847 [Russula aff. rugulosa BPL654]